MTLANVQPILPVKRCDALSYLKMYTNTLQRANAVALWRFVNDDNPDHEMRMEITESPKIDECYEKPVNCHVERMWADVEGRCVTVGYAFAWTDPFSQTLVIDQRVFVRTDANKDLKFDIWDPARGDYFGDRLKRDVLEYHVEHTLPTIEAYVAANTDRIISKNLPGLVRLLPDHGTCDAIIPCEVPEEFTKEPANLRIGIIYYSGSDEFPDKDPTVNTGIVFTAFGQEFNKLFIGDYTKGRTWGNDNYSPTLHRLIAEYVLDLAAKKIEGLSLFAT